MLIFGVGHSIAESHRYVLFCIQRETSGFGMRSRIDCQVSRYLATKFPVCALSKLGDSTRPKVSGVLVLSCIAGSLRGWPFGQPKWENHGQIN